MATRTLTNVKTPYGLSFSIEEHLLLRGWAEARGLAVEIQLDRIIDTAEFEEFVELSTPGETRRRVALWRNIGAVFAQSPGGRPRAFINLTEALAALRPAPPRRARWFAWGRRS